MSADLAATKEPEAPQAPQECTGVAASWCPVHGNCSCTRDEEGMWMGDRSAWDCPLHGDASTHADAEVALLATPPEAPSEAERLLRLTCERLIGTPVVEQSSSLADISLALDAYCARIAEAHQERRPAVTAPRTLPGEPFAAVPPKPEPAPPLGLPEWAEETRRMLVEVYPADIFVRSPESKEPGCRILHAIEEALDRYYDIKAEVRE